CHLEDEEQRRADAEHEAEAALGAPRPKMGDHDVHEQHDDADHGGQDEIARLLRTYDRADRHLSVAVTFSRSLKEMRMAQPCGHICTQAGPSGRVMQRSHLLASSTCLPSGRTSCV